MRRNWIFLALLLSVGINFGLLGMGIARHRMRAALEAERDRERDVRPALRDGSLLADRLELTGAAREGFLRLQRELMTRVHAGRQQIDEARRKLRHELTSAEPDHARVEELLAGIAREQDALDRALVANVFAARELLEGRAEREYLRFVERFGGAVAGPRPMGPPQGMRPGFGHRRQRVLGGEGPDGGPPGPRGRDMDSPEGPPDGPPDEVPEGPGGGPPGRDPARPPGGRSERPEGLP